MICMNYNHNKKFRLLKFYSGYGKICFNSPTGYSKKNNKRAHCCNVSWKAYTIWKSFEKELPTYEQSMWLTALWGATSNRKTVIQRTLHVFFWFRWGGHFVVHCEFCKPEEILLAEVIINPPPTYVYVI